MKTIQLLILGLLLAASVCRGQDVSFGGGWFNSSNAAPETISGGGGGGDYHLDSLPNVCGPYPVTTNTGNAIISEAVTPEITSLAANLQNDPLRIFDYVHNNIRYVHYFGSKKGALLTLLEGSGNDFDQCALFVALIRAASTNSGISYAAHYQFGMMAMPYSAGNGIDLQHWFGFSIPPVSAGTSAQDLGNTLNNFNAQRNYPVYETAAGPLKLYRIIVNDGTFNNFIFHRVWVRLTVGGVDYLLDPAFKVSTLTAGINVTNAMGFSAADVFTNAGSGATISNDYVQHLNWTNLSSRLTAYTTNILSYLKTYPNLSMEQVISGYDIQTSISQSFPCLNFPPVTNTFVNNDGYSNSIPILEWDNIPTNYLSTVNFKIDNLNTTFYFPAVQARKISLTFTNLSGNYQAQISLDDVVQATGTSGSGSGSVLMTNTITHPSGTWNYTSNSVVPDGRNNQNDLAGFGAPTYQRQAYGYTFAYAFDDISQLLTRREQMLDALVRQNVSSTDPRIVTETLNVMGLSWLNQIYLQASALGAQEDDMIFYHNRGGRVAAESGYFIDMRLNLSSFVWRDGVPTFAGDPSVNVIDYAQFIGSAMEHGVIEQLQGNNSVSTTKAIFQANQAGQKIILGQYNSSSNNVSMVSSLFSGESLNNYGSDASTILSILTGAGGTMLVPSGHTTNGSWLGYAFALFSTSGQGMIIAGNYGGYPATEVLPSPGAMDSSTFLSSQSEFTITPPAQYPLYVADPLNPVDGSFAVDSLDLSVGQSEPRGFSFSRHYDSNRRNANSATMANGWTHNYNINAVTHSDPDAGMGRNTPQEMASFLAAQRAGYEMFTATPTTNHPQSECWGIAALCAEWAVDNLKSNAVNVTMGTANVQFIKQPNGSYTPPAGITMTLAQSNSAYNLQMRHGNLFQFGTNGLLTNIIDQYGKSLTFTYNASNWLSTVTDWKSRSLTFNYLTNALSRLTSVGDSTGRSVSYGYTTNANGQIDLTSVIDPLGFTNTYQYDTNHQIVVTKNAFGQIVSSNVFDAFGHVTKQYSQGSTSQMWQGFWNGYENALIDPAGGQQEYFYDAKSRQIGFQDALGNLTQTFYDGQDHVVMSVSPLNETNELFYDGNNNLVETIDPLGYSNQFIYDSSLNLIHTVDALNHTNTFAYNSHFQLTTSTDATLDSVTNAYDSGTGLLTSRADAGGTTSYGYDTYGQLSSVTNPAGLGTNFFVNDALGNVLTNTSPRNIVTSFHYNSRRQLTSSTGPTNLTASIVYDAVGNVATNTDARTNSTIYTWSPTRHLLSTTLPAPGAPFITNTYDVRDWLIKTIDPIQQPTTNAYDLAGRLLSVTDPLLRATKMTYDNDGRKLTVTNDAIEGISQQYDKRGQLTDVIDQMGKNIYRTNNGAGNQILLTNRLGKVWHFNYDAANRLTNTVTPTTKSDYSVFDQRGLLQTYTDFMTHTATFGHDALGRLTSRADAVGTTMFVYDFNGNLATNSENGQALLRQFDAYDRLSTYTDAATNQIKYGYDSNGNLTSLTYPGGRAVTYLYDGLNRLTTVTDWASNQTSYTYDLASRVTSVTRPNGTVRSNYYDVAGQLTNITEQAASHAPIAFFAFHYDLAGRVQWEFMAPTNLPYTPPSRTSTFDDDNRLATFKGPTMGSAASVTMDNNGNMTVGPVTNDTFTNYVYDARNRLTSQGSLSYAYDPGNNRVAVTNGTNVTKFIIDPASSQVLMRIKGTTTNYYVYGLGLIYEVDETATTSKTGTYHFDIRGSTVALTDNNGKVTDRIQYSAYGMTTFRGGTNDTPFLFNGKFGVQTDPNGLLYMRARYYNPYICRFINADPSGFGGGLNMYAFADGNPISETDPFGLGAVGDSSSFSWVGNISNISSSDTPNLVGSGLVSSIGASALNAVTDGRALVNSLVFQGINTAINALPGGDPMALGPLGPELGELGVGAQELGTLGEAAEGEGALAGSIRNVNPTGGTMNCVNCAVASDATLGGNAASALPGGPTSISVLENTFGGSFQRVSGQMQIGSVLSQSGNGARGIVFGESMSGDVGHVFNVLNNNGTIQFLDGQIGGSGLGNFNNFQNFQFLLTHPGTP